MTTPEVAQMVRERFMRVPVVFLVGTVQRRDTASPADAV